MGKLHARLERTLARLRAIRSSSAPRRLAIQGFESTLRGVKSLLAFYRNDNGNIVAATRDAKAADRSLKKGARLIRAAGRALGVQIGSRSLRGY